MITILLRNVWNINNKMQLSGCAYIYCCIFILKKKKINLGTFAVTRRVEMCSNRNVQVRRSGKLSGIIIIDYE